MQFVQSLYRHPVKGFTPERRESLVVGPDGRVVGDRVLAFRFADAATPEDRDGLDHWPKNRGLALMDFPSLARLHVTYDEEPGACGSRFRSNIVIGGTDAWAELSWAGRVTIGAVAFRVQGPIGRCLAIHANPDTGSGTRGSSGSSPASSGRPSRPSASCCCPRAPGARSASGIPSGSADSPRRGWRTAAP